MSNVFLVVGPNSWGRGISIDQAIKECKKRMYSSRRGKLKHPLDVFTSSDPGVYVDDSGRLLLEGSIKRVSGKGHYMELGSDHTIG